jgi:hypothetical protein
MIGTQRLEATTYNSSNPTFLYEFGYLFYFVWCLAVAAAGLELPVVVF